MRRFALPIAFCLCASYGCAASQESEPAGGGNASSGGSLNTSAGSPATGGSVINTGAGTGATAGGTGGSGGSGTTAAGTGTTAAGTGTAMAGTGSGGTGVTQGAGTCATTAASTGMPMLIDDLDDGNADIMPVDGRMGGWYFSTDGTGTTMPAAGAATPVMGGMTGNAEHVTGMGLSSWGASLSAALTNPMNGCYDASKFTGITVALKGTGMVWVSVLTAAVRDAPEGMRNHYKKLVTLTPDWTTVTISFSELTQPGGWGVIVPFDATKIYGVDFGPSMATAPATTDFDFWVDNLSFE